MQHRPFVPRILAPIALAAVAALLALATPRRRTGWTTSRRAASLIVGVSDTTPPFTFKKPGASDHVGYDIDLVRAVAKRLGVTVETVSVSSAERIPMLKDGKLDFVATSMTRTPERLREIDFSVIYFVTPHAVIVKKSSGITSVQQLAGRKAASASTSTAGGNLKEVVPNVNLVMVRDYAIAFAQLKDGSVDAFPTDETVLRAIVQQDGKPDDYLFLSDFTKSRNVGFALKKDEPRFKDAINRALLDVESLGRSGQDLRGLVRPGIGAADDTHLQDPSRLKHPCILSSSRAARRRNPSGSSLRRTFRKSAPASTSAPAPSSRPPAIEPKPGQHLILPSSDGAGGVLFGIESKDKPDNPFLPGLLPGLLPAGTYRFANAPHDTRLAALAFALGSYRFGRYRKIKDKPVRLVLPDGVDGDDVSRIAEGVTLARDLINTPANDLGPAELEDAARTLAKRHGAKVRSVVGDALLKENFPLIHAVGRAAAPRTRRG